jgi:hypothetical protein
LPGGIIPAISAPFIFMEFPPVIGFAYYPEIDSGNQLSKEPDCNNRDFHVAAFDQA